MKNKNLARLLPIFRDSILDTIRKINNREFASFDVTLGDTHCQNRAFFITSVYSSVSKLCSSTSLDMRVLNDDQLNHYFSFSSFQQVPEFYLYNLAMLNMLYPINCRYYLYGVTMKDITTTKYVLPELSNNARETIVRSCKKFLINYSAEYVNGVLCNNDPYPEYSETAVNFKVLPFVSTIEKIIESQNIIVIDTQFKKLSNEFLFYSDIKATVILQNGIYTDITSVDEEKPYIVFSGYSIDTNTENLKSAIISSAKAHPRYPKDAECREDQRLMGKDGLKLTSTPFIVSHVVALSKKEILKLIKNVQTSEQYPFNEYSIKQAILNSDHGIINLSSKFNSTSYNLLSDEYITNYLETHNISTQVLDLNHQYYPENNLNIIGYSQIQGDSSIFAVHYNRHYCTFLMNNRNLTIYDSLGEDSFNIRESASNIFPEYDISYVPLDIQRDVGINSCGHIMLSVLESLYNNNTLVRDSLVENSRSIYQEERNISNYSVFSCFTGDNEF